MRDDVREDKTDIARFLWLFFSFRGRISRYVYLLSVMLLGTILVICLYQSGMSPDGSSRQQGWAIAFLLAAFAAIWSTLALAVKRLHDIGKPGALAVLILLPMLSALVFAVLCFLAGDIGGNEYASRTNSSR